MPSLFDQFQKPRGMGTTPPAPPAPPKPRGSRRRLSRQHASNPPPDTPNTIHVKQRAFARPTTTTTNAHRRPDSPSSSADEAELEHHLGLRASVPLSPPPPPISAVSSTASSTTTTTAASTAVLEARVAASSISAPPLDNLVHYDLDDDDHHNNNNNNNAAASRRQMEHRRPTTNMRRSDKDARSCPALPLGIASASMDGLPSLHLPDRDESADAHDGPHGRQLHMQQHQQQQEEQAQLQHHQPGLFRRGSAPVAKADLPLLNFTALRGSCPTANDMWTPRRRVEEIGTSLSRFRPYLYVSGDAGARDLAALRRAGVTHVANLAGRSASNYHSGELKYLRAYVRDDARAEIGGVVRAVARWIDEARASGGACLVHCRQGVSRSVTAALGYVLRREGAGLEAAMREMRTCRPIANPNAGFWEALRGMERAVRGGEKRPRVVGLRRHAEGMRDETTPWVEVGVSGAEWDEGTAYVLQRAARHGVVAWRGAECGEEEWGRVEKVAREIAEGERRDAMRFGGGAEGMRAVRQGEDGAVDVEIAAVMRLG